MLYLRKSFTCPASTGAKTSQRKWDYATLGKVDFIAKYGNYSPEEPVTDNE